MRFEAGLNCEPQNQGKANRRISNNEPQNVEGRNRSALSLKYD